MHFLKYILSFTSWLVLEKPHNRRRKIFPGNFSKDFCETSFHSSELVILATKHPRSHTKNVAISSSHLFTNLPSHPAKSLLLGGEHIHDEPDTKPFFAWGLNFPYHTLMMTLRGGDIVCASPFFNVDVVGKEDRKIVSIMSVLNMW